ncbi:MAG: DUF3800 domain-containing protein [Methylocella sp.]
MYLCYVDESGTPDVPGNTSHFVLAGITIPIWHWKDADRDVSAIMTRYDLAQHELHTAWLLRPYLEQDNIPGFENLGRAARRTAVERARNTHLLKLQQRKGGHKAYRQARKNYEKSEAYIHLTKHERLTLAEDVADTVGSWGFARLFAECIDKLHFDPNRSSRTVEEQAFEQVISRFERYLNNINSGQSQKTYGLTVHDNNETVSRKHTSLMRHFHQRGTLWTSVNDIIETPMFVDSSLTSMVQVADLCAYSLRRFVENGEENLFRRIFSRADRFGGNTVGVRHFSARNCVCQICQSHGKS